MDPQRPEEDEEEDNLDDLELTTELEQTQDFKDAIK
jgi:hypothetical protein